MHGFGQLAQCNLFQGTIAAIGRRIGRKIHSPFAGMTSTQDVATKVREPKPALIKFDLSRNPACGQAANENPICRSFPMACTEAR